MLLQGQRTVEEFFTGMLNKKLMQLFVRLADKAFSAALYPYATRPIVPVCPLDLPGPLRRASDSSLCLLRRTSGSFCQRARGAAAYGIRYLGDTGISDKPSGQLQAFKGE